jgi:hypothetical protein
MATQPWRVVAVFHPIERILHRIESDGTIDACQGQPVFYEHGKAGWYEFVGAIRGLIHFHELAAERLNEPAAVAGMVRLANKLDTGAPLFESDLQRCRESIAECKRQALSLTIRMADELLRIVQTSALAEAAEESEKSGQITEAV